MSANYSACKSLTVWELFTTQRSRGQACARSRRGYGELEKLFLATHFNYGEVLPPRASVSRVTGGILFQGVRIVDFAEENDVDLIVMGASNGCVVEQWLSSDVREPTTIPVLIIPYQIFD